MSEYAPVAILLDYSLSHFFRRVKIICQSSSGIYINIFFHFFSEKASEKAWIII